MQDNQTQSLFDEIADRFAVEIRNGYSPQVEDYANDHPDLATKILRLFPVLEMMERQGTPLDEISEPTLNAAESEIQKTLRLNPYVLKKVMRQARNFTVSHLEKAYDLLLEADVKMKSGQDQTMTLNLLIVELAGRR